MSDSAAKSLQILNEDWYDQLGVDLTSGLTRLAQPQNSCDGLEYKENRTIITVGLDREQVIADLNKNSATHLVQPGGMAFEKELSSAAYLLKNEEMYYSFPVATILDAQQVGIKREAELIKFDRRFSNDSEKIELQIALEEMLKKNINSRALLTEIVGVSDELITNVLYNAPHVPADNSTSGIQRTTQGVKLDKGKTGRLVCGMDNERVVVGCEDPYGALNLSAMLGRLQKCYQDGVADSMNTGPGGARIGMFLMFNSATSFYAGVIPGEKTSVFCVFPYKMNNKKRNLEPFNLHVFTSSREQK